MEQSNRGEIALDDDDPHYMVDRLLRLENEGTLKQFSGGLRTTFSSVRFMWKNKELWPKVAIPAIINIVVFIFTVGFMLWNYEWFLVDKPLDGSWTYYILIVLWWIYRVLLWPLLIGLSYFITLLLAGIIASPFNDALSEHTERIMMGQSVPSEEGWKALVTGGIRGVFMEAFTTIPRLFLVVLLGFIPGIGPILAAIVGAYFISVTYTDYVFERHKYPFKRKFDTIWRHRRMALGFGVGANLLLIIPLVNFLTMPIAVVGGTALALAIAEIDRNGAEPVA